LIASESFAIILHPSGEPDLSSWVDRPDPNALGRWRSNASCVAVSRNCVVTTQHQGGSTGQVVIGGSTYNIGQIWDHNDADLRVVKLQNANLAHFVELYADTNETGKQIVIGGYGKGRSSILQNLGTTYGYTRDSAGNSTLRLCTNKINSTGVAGDSYTSNIIVADFDGLNEGDSTVYEGTIAAYDSGGGWFTKDGSIWKLAGLSRLQVYILKRVTKAIPIIIFMRRGFETGPIPQHFSLIILMRCV